MCRWITLLSSYPVSISDVILSPSNSLIQLSKDASYHPEFTDMNNHVTNGDGFGVGWYHTNHCQEYGNNGNEEKKEGDVVVIKPRMHAAVFKDTQPAWNNLNLRELCMAIQSNCMIAHVRAASVFAGISQQNCHPFKAGTRLLFCHNGRIGNFDKVRRPFHQLLSDESYVKGLKGTTDSETIFALICTSLSNDGLSTVSAYEQTEPFGHERLTNAVKKVLRTIEHTLEKVGANDNFSTLNFSLTDGETVVVTRYCDQSPSVPPPSLYFAFGDSQKLHDELTESEETREPVKMPLMSQQSSVSTDDGDVTSDDASVNTEYSEKPVETMTFESKPGTIYSDIDVNNASLIIASNPLTKTHTWHPMPKNSIMWYTRGQFPELRLLRKHKHDRSKSFILSKSWRKSRYQFNEIFDDVDDDNEEEAKVA